MNDFINKTKEELIEIITQQQEKLDFFSRNAEFLSAIDYELRICCVLNSPADVAAREMKKAKLIKEFNGDLLAVIEFIKNDARQKNEKLNKKFGGNQTTWGHNRECKHYVPPMRVVKEGESPTASLQAEEFDKMVQNWKKNNPTRKS